MDILKEVFLTLPVEHFVIRELGYAISCAKTHKYPPDGCIPDFMAVIAAQLVTKAIFLLPNDRAKRKFASLGHSS